MRSGFRVVVALFCFCLIITAVSPGLLARTIDDPIKAQIEQAGGKADFPGASRLLIFDHTRADVQDTGLTYVTQERLWKVLTASGGLALRGVVFDFDPQSGHVEVREARIYKKDGAVVDLPLDRVLDYAAPARAIYWGLRQILLPVGRLEPGDALYVKSYRKGFTYALLGEEDDERFIPPMRGHYYDIVEFFDSIPVLEKSYTALLPADKPIQYEVFNGEVTSSIKFQGEKVAYQWTKKKIEPFRSESNQVARSDVGTKLLVSTSPDWEAKSRWFYQVNEDFGSFEVTPEVQAKVDEILKGVEGDEAKVAALTHWVADEIRYSGISMGEGEGFTLHKGEMTFSDRCGVCKDKAGMLVTMLRAAGFESYAAMTMAGSRIDDVPADQFNHSVTLVKHPDILKDGPGYGDYRLLDPTWVPFCRELWSSAEQQQNYLPGVPEGADLQVTPISPPENHYLKINGTSQLFANGDLEGSFTLEAEGQSDASVRSRLINWRPRPQWREYFEQELHKLSPRAELKELRYADPYDLSEPIRFTITYSIPSYAMTIGKKLFFTPLAARFPFSGLTSFLRVNRKLKDRDYPFRTRCSRLVCLSEKVTLPEGASVKKLPEVKNVEGGAAAFENSYQNEGRTLDFQSRLTLTQRIYPVEDYSIFCQAVEAQQQVMDEKVAIER